MLKTIIVIMLVFTVSAISQNKKDVTEYEELELNIRQEISSPAFILMDKTPTNILRPTEPVDFALKIFNESNSLSQLPKNFAFELAPYKLIYDRDISFNEYYLSDEVIDNIRNTFRISAGTYTDSGNTTQLSFGVSVSILRGDKPKHVDELKKFEDAQKTILSTFDDYIKQDETYQKLEEELLKNTSNPGILTEITKKMSERRIILEEEFNDIGIDAARKYRAAKKMIAQYREEFVRSNKIFERTGWKLDLAGGAVYDAPDAKVDSLEFVRTGVWGTLGYEFEDKVFLIMARYLTNPKVNDISANLYDIGGKFIWDFKKLSLGLEFIARNYVEDKIEDEAQLRYNIITTYTYGKNEAVSLTLGRDFDGTKSGSLLALLNLVIGFGSNR